MLRTKHNQKVTQGVRQACETRQWRVCAPMDVPNSCHTSLFSQCPTNRQTLTFPKLRQCHQVNAIRLTGDNCRINEATNMALMQEQLYGWPHRV